MQDSHILLSVRDLTKHYPAEGNGIFHRNNEFIHAVDHVSFDLREGETLGLVGESGCGKSTTGRLVVGMEKPDGGSILYEGQELAGMSRKELSSIRTLLQMIFQDSYQSLNPRKRVLDILADPMVFHGIVSRADAPRRVGELLQLVGLPADAADRYPHEFSGGQRQRISIARALSLNPRLIVCDEPVSALDVSIQAQILNLMKDLQDRLGVAYLFIAHGLGAVHYISDRIAVMYLGEIVELGEGQEVFRHPLHPYAQALIGAVPAADPDRRPDDASILKGEAGDAVHVGEGCRFAARCPFAADQCLREHPVLTDFGNGHLAACWRAARGHECEPGI